MLNMNDQMSIVHFIHTKHQFMHSKYVVGQISTHPTSKIAHDNYLHNSTMSTVARTHKYEENTSKPHIWN